MRILIVEDEHKIANSIKQGLSQESYAVDVAYDGTEGYDFASTEDYDLIILDWMLPGMDGMTICKKLREEKKHTPILMLTARGQLEEKVAGLNTGADDYMTKPFAFSELLARVRALARRPKVSTGAILEVRDLSLDPVTFEVKRDETSIVLSNKEYSLLHFLMRHPNKIFTKEQIINHVWNYDANVLPNSVEVYVKHLRDKIDKPFKTSPDLIHTVRGFGYKIG
jgi:DNA-binding response OmpR family regulator